MAGQGKVNGVALGSIGAGLVFLYGGIKGYSVSATIQDVIQGKTPASQSQVTGISTAALAAAAAAPGGTGGGPGAGASAAGSVIASTAAGYQGHCYAFGGAPGRDGSRCWDCSSFVNFVLAVRLGMAIPLGPYDGSAHGPNTVIWLATALCVTAGHSGSAAVAGDLLVWQTHMGIALGGGKMISAQNPRGGTAVSGIDGFMPGEVLFVRRLKAAA